MFEPFLSMDILSQAYFGNTIRDYLEALVFFLVLLVVFKAVQWVLLTKAKSLAKKTKTDIDDTAIAIIRSVRPRFYSFLAFWVALGTLQIQQTLSQVIDAFLIIWAVALVVQAAKILVDYIARKRFQGEDEEAPEGVIRLVRQLVVAVLWVFGILLILSNLGIDITSLIAGLGIGGVAVALAVQNILGDLFSSFAIYFDKPFQVGDYISVGEQSGTVERIGIKTTRIRSLQGEEIVMSNRELTSARIHNYRKLETRHVYFTVGVTYDTPQKKLERIPSIVKDVIESLDQTKFDRAHFTEFGDSALKFELVYWVLSDDFTVYRDTHHQVLLGINDAFAKENITFAFPTQTIHLEKT